ncbi:MAG: ABC transporter substrate-binding protein [Verrucomicrobiales bacterium]|nr:ABC transporter substrate-binding protein [Verrucomicrobiales bacterium]|tara:strand:- start:1925 stop:2836 length:912 start_codon:yes stop_codon:yes gene_type:complete
MKLKTLLIALGLALLGPAFQSNAASKIKVTTTIGMVGDLVKQVGGNRVDVAGLMGPGVDPHLYKATAADVSKLRRANVIFYNGLDLEGKMTDILKKLKRSKKHVYAITEWVNKSRLLKPEDFEGHYDPHLWFDVSLWSECVDAIVDGLGAYSHKDAAYFKSQGNAVKARLAGLHKWAAGRANEIPKDGRILITSHDAYNYFGRAYGFQVTGLQGISTVTEAGLKEMASLVDFIKKHKVKAIFVESSVSPAAIRRISQDAGVKIGGELFSDAMGTPGQMENGYDVGTYEGMIKHNLNTIVDALK